MDHYAVIGNPVAHSRSPWIHHQFAVQTGQSLEYTARLAPVDGFEASVNAFRKEGGGGGLGLNVTVPFKTQAFTFATQHSQRALQAQAVNTLIWTGSNWRGDNTDGIGLCRDLLYQGFEISQRNILILGAGGAVQGLLPILLEYQPAQVILVNRTLERAQTLVEQFQSLAPNIKLQACSWNEPITTPIYGVIQATSTGLHTISSTPFQWPTISPEKDAWCYDLVYGEAASMTAQWAKTLQMRFADGLGMLVEQAAESFWLWRNCRPETRSVLTQLKAHLYTQQSLTP